MSEPHAPLSLKVFISSPADVRAERDMARSVLASLEKEPQFEGRVRLREVSWDDPEKPAAMDANLPFQRAIDRGLPKPSECDVVIVILWSRLGSEIQDAAYAKPDGGRYTGTEWEFRDAAQAADRTGSPTLWVYRRSMAISYLPGDPQRAEKRRQEDKVETFFAESAKSYHWHAPPPGEGAAAGAADGVLPFDDLLRSHLRDAIWQRMELAGLAGLAAQQVDAEDRLPAWPADKSPFRGLEPFTAEYAPVFRGREAELAALLEDVATKPFVALLGLSGSGKSSLVYAGLLPALAAGRVPGSDGWRQVNFKPGELSGGPLESFAAALVAAFPARGWCTASLAARLRGRPADIASVAAEALQGASAGARLLVFIDQFEEVFADSQPARADRPGVFALLRAAAEPESPMRVVIALRADFYGQWPQDEASITLLNAGQRTLGTPRQSALERMIREPARAAGLRIADRLVQRILDEAGNEPSALPLAEFALSRLYALRRDGELTGAAFDAIGGLTGAIDGLAEEAVAGRTGDEGWAEEAVRALAADTTAQTRALARLFQAIASVADSGGQRAAVRLRAPASTLDADAEVRALAECLLKKRLLVRGGGEAQAAYVEVAHEALFSRWRRLATWLDEFGEALQVLRHVEAEARVWHANPANRLHQPWPAEAQQVAYDALAKLGRAWDTERDPMRGFLQPEWQRLEAELNDPEVGHYRRCEIGDRLAAIGDPRPGVGLRADGLPDIAWVAVPAGEVGLGEDDDKSLGRFAVRPFYMARYPVTWRQYRAFVEAEDGYRNPAWWEGLEREEEAGEQFRCFDNCPADRVSWHDAMAFCQWLTEAFSRVLAPEDPLRGQLEAGKQVVRLPLEWEWQQAATLGDASRGFPWGEWHEGLANTGESRLGRTTAVGMYPAVIWPLTDDRGRDLCQDLAGNVWEWCANQDDEPRQWPLTKRAPRALRGGSWNGNRNGARCACRHGDFTGGRYSFGGFRVVCALPISESLFSYPLITEKKR